ncbi:MAG TPA: hypothetical protein VFJ07_20590 [Streptosporangiaceae bacterium]|nr:hypothetical protein [Streptosporangiaceae bacterium]
MNPRMRLAACAAVTATIAGLLGASAAPAGAAAGPTARLQNGILAVTGTPARDVLKISMGHRQVAVDFGFDGTIDARFPMSGVRQLSVQLGDGNDGLSVIGAGVGDVPITISGALGNDAAGVVGTEDPLLARNAPVTISGGGGNDNLSASVPGTAPVSVNAGAGDDVVSGGDGSIGPEKISLGGGNDKFVSTLDVFNSPFTARNDAVDGGTGKDTLELRGTFASESLSLSADAGHLIALHDGGDRTDSIHVENVTWFGFGGNDESGAGDDITVNDLSGTGVVNFTPDFSSPSDATAPNNSADQLRVVATPGDDHITVDSFGATINVSGLAPAITPVLLDASDVLRIDTLAGNDTVDTTGLPPGQVQLQVS